MLGIRFLCICLETTSFDYEIDIEVAQPTSAEITNI